MSGDQQEQCQEETHWPWCSPRTWLELLAGSASGLPGAQGQLSGDQVPSSGGNKSLPRGGCRHFLHMLLHAAFVSLDL